ncbi:MAG: MerR family transcriptional regulator [Candidatus Dependentiae bacterium]
MKMQRRQFRIGELAKQLKVEKYVVRFWEKEFNFKSVRSAGKQRFYSEKDLETFLLIKELLYEKGFTITGAKKQLLDRGTPTLKQDTKLISSTSLSTDSSNTVLLDHSLFIQQLITLREQLRKLKKLL